MNKTINEISKLSNKESDKVLKALRKLYNELNYPMAHVRIDWDNDFLTLIDKNVLWYLDSYNESAVRIDTCELLTDEEMSILIGKWVCKECAKYDK